MTGSALRSLDGKDGVSFHTFTFPEDRCARLLVKNLGTGMPESVAREDLESLNICVQGVTQLRSGRRDPDPAKDRPPTPTSLCQWRADLSCPRCAQSPSSAVCECRWSSSLTLLSYSLEVLRLRFSQDANCPEVLCIFSQSP